MKALHKTLLAALLGSAAFTAAAQEMRTSYFMETAKFRHQLNPAYISDQRYVSMPLLGNFNVGSVGNFGARTFIYDIDPAQNNGRRYGTFLHPDVSSGQFFSTLGSDDVQGGVYLNMNLISVGFKAWKGNNIIDVNLRSNTDFKLPNQLFRFAKESGANSSYNLSDLGMKSQSYLEVALGHSHAIDDHFVVGAKAKLLFGLAYANLKVKQLDLTLDDNKWEVMGQAEGAVAFQNTHFRMDSKGRLDDLEDFKGGMTGFGVAFDLGATYKVHGMENLTLSAALNDMGGINHSQAQNLKTKDNAKWTFSGFRQAYVASDKSGSQELGHEFDQMGEDLKDMLNLYDTGRKGHGQGLATTLNIGAEYTLPVYDKLSFGLLHSHRINDIYGWNSTMLSARVRPIRLVEVGLSTAFTSTGTQFGGMLTLNARGFHFFVAADRFVGRLSKQGIPLNSLNSNVAFGIGFPLSAEAHRAQK